MLKLVDMLNFGLDEVINKRRSLFIVVQVFRNDMLACTHFKGVHFPCLLSRESCQKESHNVIVHEQLTLR